MNSARSMPSRLAALGSVYAKDWLRYRRRIGASGNDYLAICNRYEALEAGPAGIGHRCLWQWTSILHAPTVVPDLGLRLMRRALSDHPVERAVSPRRAAGNSADVTFLIGHRGSTRLPLLQATIESIAAQRDVSVECVVVEQEAQAASVGYLPAWVRHVHTPPQLVDMGYCRSWAFNVAARHATGRLLVLHDNDMLVPQDYAASLLKHFDEGCEVVNLKRFVFYLSEQHTTRYLAGEATMDACPPEAIVQNLEAGGSVAIGSDAYRRIGGMDESFIGWGGEDNEFWERAHTLRVWPYAYLPIVHLWHEAQPGKNAPHNPALRLHRSLSCIRPAERIARLRGIKTGLLSGPVSMHD